MMLATDTDGRHKALKPIKEFQKHDFKGLFTAMKGLPVTIRLLDPPLHEFMPHGKPEQESLAPKIGKSVDWVEARVHSLAESNPMLGHRGVRLGITYPEIYETQVEAIIEAAIEVSKESGANVVPE